jgi:hypothetical protein
MTTVATIHTPRAALAAMIALFATCLPVSAHADTPGAADPTFTGAAPTAPATNEPSSQGRAPIVWLPDSAWPKPTVWGLEGGSLWWKPNGMQWPYVPKTEIGVSGDFWLDTGYEHIASGDPSVHSIKYLVQNGRFVVRVTPTLSDGRWFAQGQVELVGEEDQSQAPPIGVNVDDAWLKAGLWNKFDVQIGRFEGWEIYHRGLGLDYYTLEYNGAALVGQPVPLIYGVTDLMYRPQSLGAAAGHYYPFPWLRFELGLHYGNELGLNTYGVRPVGILDLGMIKFKVGAEYQDQTPRQENTKGETKQQGAGAALQFVLDPYIEFGINGAYSQTRQIDNMGNFSPTGSFDQYTVGAFATGRVVRHLLVGAGLDYSFVRDELYNTNIGRQDDYDHWQAYLAVQYQVWGGFLVKNVLGYALANENPTQKPPFQNIMVSERLRVEYLF